MTDPCVPSEEGKADIGSNYKLNAAKHQKTYEVYQCPPPPDHATGESETFTRHFCTLQHHFRQTNDTTN